MKILLVIPEYPPYSAGGVSTFYRHLLPELTRNGHSVHALVGNAFTSDQDAYESEGVKVEFLDSKQVARNLSKFDRYRAIPEFQRHLAAAWTAWEQVNGGLGYDLVETTDWGLLFIPWLASPDSPPTVVQLSASIGQIDFHDPQRDTLLQGNLTRLIELGFLALADELQTYSRSNAQSWGQLVGRDVTYIPPALPVPAISPVIERSQNGLVVGRIQYWKGPTVLCEALQRLGQKSPTIDWIGRDTVYRDSNSSMAGYLAKNYPQIWGKTVQPLGTFSPDETRQRQLASQFMIVPSIWDVFNYTCAEGMAQAQVVMCASGAGAVDLIRHGSNGLTFSANNSEALVTCLEQYLGMSAGDRTEMGKAAQQTIQTELAPSKIAQERIAAYEKLIQRGKHPTRPHSWLLEAISPSMPLSKPLAFLDHLPLGELSQYVLERSFKKLVG